MKTLFTVQTWSCITRHERVDELLVRDGTPFSQSLRVAKDGFAAVADPPRDRPSV